MRRLTSPARLLAVLAAVALLSALPLAGTASSGVPTPTTSTTTPATGNTGASVLMLQRIVDAVGTDAVPAATHVNEKDVAADLGISVDVVTDAQWAAMTAADFARYKAIVLGDPFCSESAAELLAAPLANLATWTPVVRGNVFVHTFDAALHSYQSGQAAATRALMGDGMSYAIAAAPKTGLYLSTSCYHDAGPINTLLGAVEPSWTFVPQGDLKDVDTDTVFVVGSLPPQLAGLTSAALTGWDSSTHGMFSVWPASFQPMALISARKNVDPPSVGASGQASTAESACECVEADAVTINGITGSPVILIRGALEDPPVVEPTFTG